MSIFSTERICYKATDVKDRDHMVFLSNKALVLANTVPAYGGRGPVGRFIAEYLCNQLTRDTWRL